jgi:hypothetical protein
LLSHRPKVADYVGDKVDLILSGHTHGGQIYPFGIFSKLANKYLDGYFRINKS